MKKKLIAFFLGANALALGGDAVTDNIPKIDAKDIPVAEEVVKIKEVDNVVEAEFSWKDATPIKVSYDQGEPTLAEKVKDERDTSVITETVSAFDGGFKVDILLNKIPASNVFCYAIQGAENYDFFYQRQLTKQEIEDGLSQSPEIIGSYAVYHKTLKGHELGKENYATGKVMHIPRPQVWSTLDADTKVWADMNYQDGQLCVTVPQDFLDKAKYPVRVDPTFGYTSVGSISTGITNQAGASSIRKGIGGWTGAAGTLDSLHVVILSSSGGSDTITASTFLNTEDTAGDSHSQVATVERTSISINGTASFYTFTAAGESISAVSYVLSVSGDQATGSGNTNTRLDFTGNRNNYGEAFAGGYSASKEDPWTETDSSDPFTLSMYATYTASGGGGGGESTVVQDIFWFD